MSEISDPAARRARQKKILVLLGFGLIAGGLVILLLLQRMPMPLRILVGLTDIVAGLTMLVVARQKF